MMDMELNEAQRRVVGELDRNILLTAPAGTGKTNTLACRIVNIITSGRADPAEILCLTFTNKACREMKERIELRVSEAAGSDDEAGKRAESGVYVRTFHGFCYDIVKAEAKRHSDWFADFTVFDEDDCRAIIRGEIEKMLPGATWTPTPAQLQPLLSLMKVYKGLLGITDDGTGSGVAGYRQVMAQMVAQHDDELRRKTLDERYTFSPQLYQFWTERGAEFTAAYDDRLRERHGVDYDDLIAQADALLRDSDVRRRWSQRFVYINIDEIQDTSEWEYSIVERLFPGSHMLLAGDYFQTIYEWRGSHPDVVMRRYQEKWQPLSIVFTRNYRSTQVLLNAAFAVLSSMFPERVQLIYPSGMQAESQEYGCPIEVKGAYDVRDEALWIYERIARLPLGDDSDYSRIVILTRQNKYNQQLSEEFERLNSRLKPGEKPIPFMMCEREKFFHRQEVKDVLAFLRLLVNKNDVTSLVRLVARFIPGVGLTTVRTLSSEAVQRTGLRLTDLVDRQARASGDPYAPLEAALAAGNVVVFDVESTGTDVTHSEIIQMAAVRLGPAGEVTARFNELLHISTTVGDSVRVHGITDEKLAREGRDQREVMREFCEFARGAMIVGHNVTYDLSILRSSLSRLGLEPFEYAGYFDTLDIFRRFHPALPNHKLEFLCQEFAAAHKSSHDAFDDIMATADILMYALEHDIRPQTAARREYMQAYQERFTQFASWLAEFRQEAALQRPYVLIGNIVLRAGIADYYQKHDGGRRMENLRQLYREARNRDCGQESQSAWDALLDFLQYTTLSDTDLDHQQGARPQIPIITVHQAKGSEFDYVFLAGMQDGTFPGYKAVKDKHLDEEKRLFYVAVTRARRQLFISWSQHRNNSYYDNNASRFLQDLPRDFVQYV